MPNRRETTRFASTPATIVRDFGILVAIASALLTVGCGRKDTNATQRKVSSPRSVVAGNSSEQPPKPQLSLERLSLPGDNLVAEAQQSEWTSEAISNQVTSQLNALGRLITRPNAKNTFTVSENFRCSPFRPNSLQPTYQDKAVRVIRGKSVTLGESTGHSALQKAIESLKFHDVRHVRFEQKLVRVDISDEQIETQSIVQFFANLPESSVQQKATWRCRWRTVTGDHLELLELSVPDFEEATAQSFQVRFPEITASVVGTTRSYNEILSVGFDYWLDRIEGRFGIFPTAWHGLAIGDANGDGLEDVYICEPGGLPNVLYVRNADGTAKDGAVEAGLDIRDHTHSALFVDLDNDGDQDLVLGTLVGVVIFANDGAGHFARQTTKYTPEGMPFSLSAADFDIDGDLDLYVCCYSKRRGMGSNQFIGIEGRPVPYHDANNGARNLLLLNEGSWRFPDVARRVGLDQNNRRFSFAAAWEDFDDDGDLDLYVANDYGRNNLYQNERGRFNDVAKTAGVEDISAGMSVSWGDVNNDGRMDLYIANMFSSAGNRVAYQRQFLELADESTRADFQRHARGNSLFINSGDGTFHDASESAHVTMGRWAWGSPLVDLNNDGRKDIISANGFLTQELEVDL